MVVRDLGEVTYGRRCGVGDKSETMVSRARWRCRGDLDGCGVLKEISGEGVHVITKLQPPRNTTPLEMEQVDRGGHTS